MSLHKKWCEVDFCALQPGSHIRFPGVVYDHHMLVIRVIDHGNKKVLVIHYYASDEDHTGGISGLKNKIVEAEITIREYTEMAVYQDHVKLNEPEEAIERARSRLGETEYGLLSNNCESFVNWALCGADVTDQGKRGQIAAGIFLGIGVVGAIIIGLFTLFKRG